MDAGTIIAIIQLSASVFKLGREISSEFFVPDSTPDKLRHLNTRLRILNEFLETNLERPGSPDKLPTTRFSGLIAIEKTLKECKTFLEDYRSLLLKTTGPTATAQRVMLKVGPSASRIDDFHKKIDRHYAELGQWQIGSLADKMDELYTLINSLREAIPVASTNSIPTFPNSYQTHATPQITSYPGLNITTPAMADLPANQQPLISPRTRISPVLRAQPPTPSLNSFPEPPPATIPSYSIQPAEGGSVTSSIGMQSYDGSIGPAQSSLWSASLSGNYITLLLGTKEELRFSPDVYKVYTDDRGRIIDWFSPQIRVRHFLPSGTKGIPYTKPKNPKIEVAFLPHGSEHSFEVTTASEGIKRTSEKCRYQFTNRMDREIFQRQVRTRQYLQTVEVLKIHTPQEKNVAVHVHLKVWSRNDQDVDPTFSFAYLGPNEPNHHVEYKIRWFRREPERKGDKRLILQPYSEDTDLSYGPASDDTSRKSISGTLKDIRRRMSTSPVTTFTSHSPSTGHPPVVLYDGKGRAAPEEVKLGYLDMEFQTLGIREKFVNSCYEANHHTSRRATSEIEMPSSNPPSLFSLGSSGASQATTPQHSISELEGLSPATELDGSSHPVEMSALEYSLRLPSPAIPRTVPFQFNNPNPFTLPDPAIPTVSEAEASDEPSIDPRFRGAHR
ncbi:hypothetical protein F5Y10DRAFT_272672 [Nemania abortiva]|nr:hypothetical protein F5Y10DRAFT_272672 [Nemania abortiva]